MSSIRMVTLLALSSVVACDGPGAPAESPDTAAPSGEPFIASLAQIMGDVRAQPATSAAWSAASPGQRLRRDDAVQTMADSHASIAFEGTGSVARLGPSTTLRITQQHEHVARLRHVSGTLTARVDGVGEALEVELPPGTLHLDPPAAQSPRAVEARLEVTEGETEIVMVSGGAQLVRGEGPPIRVRQDHFIVVDDHGDVRDEGRTGAVVALSSPADAATVRTRNGVRFEWEPTDATGYVIELVPEAGGEATHIETDVASTVVDLPSGDYRWSVRGVIEGEPLAASDERGITVVRDRAPPTLTLLAPRASAVVTGPTLSVVGETDPGATVSVDGEAVHVDPSGRFRHAHPLPRGLANVVIVTRDDLGNARAISRTVRRE